MTLKNVFFSDQQKQDKSKAQYFCPNDGCVKEFKNQRTLDQHVLTGNCEMQLEKSTLDERMKSLYAKKLSDNGTACPNMHTKQSADIEDDETPLSMGWAFKVKKKKTVFSTKQKNYMVEKFNIGKHGGCKVDPFTAAEDMQNDEKFQKDDFLTGQQIASFFSRLAQQNRKMDQQDFRAAQDEESKANLKTEILGVIGQ